MEELKQKISSLEERLKKLASPEEIEKKRHQARDLESASMKADFWSDREKAQETMRNLADLNSEIRNFESWKEGLQTLKELADLEQGEPDLINLEIELRKIEEQVGKAEMLAFLSGPYDHCDSLVSVHSGQGGTEAMDWAAMLLRMYLRFSDAKGWEASLIEETKGEEAGLKSATVEIKGRNAYGLLKNEAGTHRLVRQSPFNADALRQTSFALVEILPVIPPTEKKPISSEEIEMESFRSSGPGGQNVQKVNTAVRLKHLPTGIVVTAQSERSQLQNKENALKLLTAKIYLLEEEKAAKEEKALKGEHKLAGWGNQIRSYVLHPYKQVKDLRTGFTSTDPEGVLAGDLDGFIEAELTLKK